MPKAIQPDFKSIFESVPSLNLILLPNLTIVAVSNAYLQATMTKRTDIIGHLLFEIFPDNPADSGATGVSNLRFSLNYVLEHKTAHTMAAQKYDIRKPDGTFEERYWSPINKPVLDAGNEVEYIIHRVEDITEFILMKNEQAEKKGNEAALQLQIEEMEIETFKRSQEIQQINQKLLIEIELKKKAEENLIEINNVLDLKVLDRTSEIQKSKNTLAETFERITDAFVALDKDWCYTYVNAKAEQIFNKPHGYLIGKHIWTEFPEGIDQIFYKAYHRAMAEQKYIHVEEYYPPYDKCFENHIYPSPDGLSVFFRDVTKNKKGDEALKEKNKFIESIINASPDIIYIYDIEERKNIYVNEGIQINLGYTNDEIKQMGNQVIATLLHPDDFDHYLQNIYPKYEALKEKEIIANEFRMKDKTGNWHWLCCKESIFLRKPDGTPKQIFGVSTDITERKNGEENLREVDQRLTKHLYNTPLAVIEWDKNFIIQKWSPLAENIFGWKETEVVNKHFNELNLVFEEDAGATGIIAKELMTGAVDKNRSINRNNTKSGKVIYCQWFNSVLKDKKGKVQSILSLIQDITENKKTNLILACEKEVLEMITTEKSLEEILNTVALNYESYSDHALCSILLLNEGGTHIRFGAAPSLPDAYNKGIDGIPIGPVAGSCGTAAYRKKRVIVSDIATDPLWVNYRDFALSFGLKACWSTPILNSDGKVYGVFAIYYKECRIPVDEDFVLIDSVANQVKIVLERYYKNKQIKESEENYRSLIEQATDGIIQMNDQGEIILVNTALSQMLGYTTEEILKLNIKDTYLKIEKPLVGQRLDQVKEKSSLPFERTMIKKDGTTLPVEVSIGKVGAGKVLGIVREITERKKNQEALAESENYLRTILQTEPECIKLLGRKGELLSMNPAGLAMIDADNEEQVVGHLMIELVNTKYKTAFKRLITEVFKGNSRTLEFEITGLKGSQRWLETHAVPLKDAKGKIISLLGLTRDITEQKKTDDILRENYFSLSEAQRISKTGNWTYYMNGDLKWSDNMYQLYGLPLKITDTTPDFFFELVHADDREIMQRWMQAILAGETPGEYEFRSILPDGSIHYYRGSGELKYDKENRPVYIRGTVQDITEHKKDEEEIINTADQLRQLTTHLQNIREEERKRIGREIHDELGQQLTAIKMDVAWLDKKIQVISSASKESAVIKSKLKNIITLLDGSNESVRKILNELRPGILDDYGLMDALEWQGRQFTKSTGIAIEFTGSQTEIKLSHDIANCIFRVYQESLTNIMRYAHAKKVLASLSINDDRIILTVKDDGKGFDTASDHNKKSFGILGMKERVLSLNGKFELVSAKGKGTRIVIKLPYNT